MLTRTKYALQDYAEKLNHLAPLRLSTGETLPGLVVEGSTDISLLKTILCEKVEIDYAEGKDEALRWGKELQHLVANRPVFTIVDADFERFEPGDAANPAYAIRCDRHDTETMFYSCGYADVQRDRLHLDFYSDSIRDSMRDLVHEAGWALYSNVRSQEDFNFDSVCLEVACQLLEGAVEDPLEGLYHNLRWGGSVVHTDAQISRLRTYVAGVKKKFGKRAEPGVDFDWDLTVGHHVAQAFAAMSKCLPISAMSADRDQYDDRPCTESNIRYGLKELVRTDVGQDLLHNERVTELRQLGLFRQLRDWESERKCRLLKCDLASTSSSRQQDCRHCPFRMVRT